MQSKNHGVPGTGCSDPATYPIMHSTLPIVCICVVCAEMLKDSWLFVHDKVIFSGYSTSTERNEKPEKEVILMPGPDVGRADFENEPQSSPENGDSEEGTYRFTRDEIYSDAHYEPAGTSTEPPRYYTPPERPVKEHKPRKKRVGWFKVLTLCLVCALLGGCLGAAISERRTDRKLAELQQNLNESMEERFDSIHSDIHSLRLSNAGTSQNGSGLTGAQIFEMAKEQVVGISTEVTYQNFFGMTSSSAVSGSGFFISEDGYIMTNYHVIETAYTNNLDITVMTYDGTQYTASIIGFESGNDVAVLKIDATGRSPVSFGNSEEITMGETVYAVGNPLGELAYSMSTGTISGLDREIVTDDSVVGINMFQIDAAVNPGNSGGPVYNACGEVIGIVTAKSGATNAEGLGFAIPINDASTISKDLMTKGYVTGKAYMGVRLDERYNSMYAQYYNMPLGAYVYSVDNGGAAERAGLQAGDIITKLGETEITSYTDLKAAVRGYSAGDSADITVFRAGSSITITILFDEARPAGVTENSNEVLDPYSSEQN